MVNAAQPTSPWRRVWARIAEGQGLLLPWAFALVLGVTIALFGPSYEKWSWYSAAAGVCIIIAFIVQLIISRADGFILRTATASLGCVLLLGLVSAFEVMFIGISAGFSFDV